MTRNKQFKKRLTILWAIETLVWASALLAIFWLAGDAFAHSGRGGMAQTVVSTAIGVNGILALLRFNRCNTKISKLR